MSLLTELIRYSAAEAINMSRLWRLAGHQTWQIVGVVCRLT